MTRAIERLIVCGVDGEQQARRTAAGMSWWRRARAQHCVDEPADDGDGEVRRYRKMPDAARARRKPPTAGGALAAARLAATQCAGVDSRRRAAPIKPSGFVDDHEAAELLRPPRGAAARDAARQHRAPAAAVAAGHSRRSARPRRRAAIIARQSTDFSAAERDAIAEQVLALLDDPRFAALFAPGSRAEVPIVGR